jgi:hypothetical protein
MVDLTDQVAVIVTSSGIQASTVNVFDLRSIVGGGTIDLATA